MITHYPYYHQVSNIRRTLVGNTIVDHSDVAGASPVGAARSIYVFRFGAPYIRDFTEYC